MHYDNYHPTELNNDALKALQQVEQELGRTLVAFSPDDQPAQLSEEEVARIKSLEECLSATVIAY